MGHHSPAFTMDVYVHLLSDDLPEAAFLDDLGGGTRVVQRAAETERDREPVAFLEKAV
jgi:hypothetical protein